MSSSQRDTESGKIPPERFDITNSASNQDDGFVHVDGTRGNILKMKYAGCLCIVCLLLAGITFAIMGAVGYYNFKSPCVGIQSMSLGKVDIDYLSVFAGDPKGSVDLDITLQINNTNPYGLTYKQSKIGIIGFRGRQVGKFNIPDGVSEARNSSKSLIKANIKAGSDGIDISEAMKFVAGKEIQLNFAGEISAVGWLDFAPAVVGFKCNATVMGISGADAIVDCYAEYEVKVIGEKGSATITHEDMQVENKACYL
jgi:hypothetical protein